MPAHKKDHTTPEKKLATKADLPEQQDFHQHLRELIRGATRIVMEEIMCEELAQFLQAEWGKSLLHAKAIATAPTRAICSRVPGRLKI